ncbi:MAG: HDOD domain-containing protein [Sulfuritalea sp.]|nr:HDOD domain-containing protein [Sulfuritalea sp.]
MTVRLSLEQVLTQAAKLPALPQIVAQIIDMLGDEEASVESLSTHIVSDPAIVARLLAAANAGALGTGGRITSVRQAIMLLGVGRVRDITLATAIIDRYKAAPPFDAHRLWLHSVGVAVCAQEVARIGGLDPDIAYTAGLLHDIGQLLLFAVNPAAYGLMLTQKAARDMDIVEAEREYLGLDHAHVGGELARLWKLPEAVADAIAAHHVSDQNEPESELADAVHVAEVLSYALDLGGFDDARVPNLSVLSCARMGIDWRGFADHFPRIEARFATARITLGL